MAIQPLATQIQAPQIQTPNPINQMGQLMALRDSQQQNQLRTMQMQDLQQKQAREQQVRNVFASGGEPDRNALYAASPDMGMAYDEFRQRQQKTGFELNEAERKAANEITADYRDQISRLNTTDPNVFMRDFGLATGMIHSNEVMSKVFANTRASTEGSMKEAYAAAEAGPEAMEALKARITRDSKTFQSNLETPQAREAREEIARHNREMEKAARDRADKTGSGAGTTEGERTAAYHIERFLSNGNQIIDSLSKDAEAAQPGFFESAAQAVLGEGGTANFARSPQRQVVNSSQNGMLESLIYLTTGAAATEGQVDRLRSELIPSFTDELPNLQAKQTRFNDVITAAKARAGRAWTPEMDAAAKNLAKSMSLPPGGKTPAPSNRETPPVDDSEEEEAYRAWAAANRKKP